MFLLRMPLLVLVVAVALLASTHVDALATIGPPLKVTLASEPAIALAGARYEGVVRLQAGAPIVIEELLIEGEGWQLEFESAPGTLALSPGGPLDLRFVGTPIDPDAPVVVRARLEERWIAKSFALGPRGFAHGFDASAMTVATEVLDIPRAVTTVDAELLPAPVSRPAAKDRTPSLATIRDAAADGPDSGLRREPGDLGKRRQITVQGRFVYTRDDGVTLGVDNATARVYDEDFGPDELLASGLTDTQGNFSFSFDWDPCFICDDEPDLYVEIELNNSKVTVESATFEINYTFVSGTVPDFTGSFYNFGLLKPASESLQPGPHIFNQMVRTWRWIVNNTPYNTPKVEVQWPDGDTGAFYRPFFEEIHISTERQWNEATCAHEYGHHFIHQFAIGQTPDYCNGICDSPTEWYEFWDDGCGHCIWCEETDHDAWNEGWPNWLADVVTRAHTADYGHAVRNTRDMEVLARCFVDNTYHDPLITEGPLAALLRDIEDATDEIEPGMNGEDRMSWGSDEIFTVTVLDKPRTPTEFLSKFLARYGTTASRRENFWYTARNNGYETDTQRPQAATNLTSTSHSVGVASAATVLRMSWTRALDDQSGIQGYGIFVSTGGPSIPSTVMDIGNVTQYSTPNLAPGTYYFNLRALDNAGKWSNTYATAGPFVIRDPEPANLVFETGTGWGATVVPRTTADSAPTYVPAPATLPGNTRATYWNLRAKNVGESSVACCPTVNVRLDGVNMWSNPFDPQDVSDLIGGLGPNTVDNSLNQGPVFVPGGRHTFGAMLDSGEAVPETNEIDNFWARQWVWTPLSLTAGIEIVRGQAPDRDGGWSEASGTLWYNADGLRIDGTGWWNAVWVHAVEPALNVDVRLHQPSTGAAHGFTSNVGWSTRGPGRLDAVLVNRNVTGQQSWDVGVLDSSNDFQAASYRTSYVRSRNFAFGDSTDATLGAGKMMDLLEVYVPAYAVGPVSVTLALHDEHGPAFGALQAAWFDASFGTGGLNYASAAAVTHAASGFCRLEVDVPAAGYYGVAIFRDPVEGSSAWNYTIEIDRTPPDWLPLKPATWYAPVVPHRADADLVNLQAPPSLPGNANETYVSLTLRNDGGIGSEGPFQAFTRIDGVDVTGSLWSDWPAQLTRTVLARGPVTVRGGRHTLTLVCDPLDEYEEISETNNVFGEQWIWTPFPMSFATPVTRAQPSDRTVGWSEISTSEAKWFNADGLRTPLFVPDGTNGYWGAVATMSAPSSNVDIRWHEISAGAKDGFAANLGLSAWGPEQSDLLLVNFNQTQPRPLDVGVLDLGGVGGYTAEVLSSIFLGTPEIPVATGPFSLGPGRIAALFEIELQAGTTLFHLQNLGGDADLGLSLHVPGTVFATKSDALTAAWFEPEGADERLTVDVPESGYHALVVWKVGSGDLDRDASFDLRVATGATSTPPPATSVEASRIQQVVPNPFNPRTTIAFDVRTSGETSIEIHNVRGEKVRTLLAPATQNAGRHEVVWDGTDDEGRRVASGTYFVSLRTVDGSDRRKVTLVK